MARAKQKSSSLATGNRPVIILAIVTVACLLPFIGKAFHIDDPLFVWTAQQIRSQPLNPYGFQVNWYGTDLPMWQVTQNPPLACYYIALASCFVGWREAGIHAFMIVPAVMVVLGTYRLARHMCSLPLLAALISLLTPVFLISSTTVMCDVLMLAFWVWAVCLWLEGLESGHEKSLVIAALLIAAAVMTKYYGAALIPLLLIYSTVKKRGLGRWAIYLLIPVGASGLYQLVTQAMYGTGLLLAAATFANSFRGLYEKLLLERIVIGLSFTGGCLITAVFYAPLVWSRRALAVGLVLIVAAIAGLAYRGALGSISLYDASNGIRWFTVLEISLFAATGLGLIVISCREAIKHRDAETILLGLWLVGTLVFASVVNWSINGRSILPAAPAIGILLVRAIDARKKAGQQTNVRWLFVPLIPAAILALWATYGDYALANAWRTSARQVCDRYSSRNTTTFSQGHWGFQYYAMKAGAVELDVVHSALDKGDILVLPLANTNLFRIPADHLDMMEPVSTPVNSSLATMTIKAGAGFYSEAAGPLPYAIADTPDLTVDVAVVRRPFALRGAATP